MHLIYEDVNDAFYSIVRDINDGMIETVRKPSRVGDVIMVPEPVILTYKNPRSRVLLCPERDANPFFHIYESLFMLAGRHDIAPLNYYSANYHKFVDDGDGIQNAAYGYRWRHAHNKPPGSRTHGEFEGTDQLRIIIEHLKQVPTSRRVVLQMWNVEDDLLKIGPKNQTKDTACNLSVMFAIREEEEQPDIKYLDMTVTNRSNDLILGTLGANYVHFSILQEYMASLVGVEVGMYHQFTNNLHAYTERWFPDKWLNSPPLGYPFDSYGPTDLVRENPLGTGLTQQVMDQEIERLVAVNDGQSETTALLNLTNYSDVFLNQIAAPMCMAFHDHKMRRYDLAYQRLDQCIAGDWKAAAIEWLNRRERNYINKQGETE